MSWRRRTCSALQLVDIRSKITLALFVGMAGVKSLSNPIEHLVIERKLAKHLTATALEYFLADVRLSTPAFITGAMIVDVALLLDFSD